MLTAKAHSAIERLTRDTAELADQLITARAEYERCNAQITEKLGQQRLLVVAARVRKEKNAQAEIDRLTTEIRSLQEANLQNCTAVEELGSLLEAKREAINREERRVRFSNVLALLQPRLDGALEARQLELAEELKSITEKLRASDAEI